VPNIQIPIALELPETPHADGEVVKAEVPVADAHAVRGEAPGNQLAIFNLFLATSIIPIIVDTVA